MRKVKEVAVEEVQDPEVLPDKGRNKQAAARFAQLLKSGEVPSYVKEMWLKANRDTKTQMINTLFTKDKKGKWSMTVENPSFQRIVKSADMTFGTDMIESVPRSVMLHITFRGDEVAMNTAIACGDLVVQHVAGKEMVGYSKVQVGRTKQTADEGTMKGGSIEMTALGFEAMSGAVSSLASFGAAWSP